MLYSVLRMVVVRIEGGVGTPTQCSFSPSFIFSSVSQAGLGVCTPSIPRSTSFEISLRKMDRRPAKVAQHTLTIGLS